MQQKLSALLDEEVRPLYHRPHYQGHGDHPIMALAPAQDNTRWRQQNVGRLLNNAVKRFESQILEHLEKVGHGGLSLSHIAITRNLDLEGTRATELARRAGITKQSAGELIAQLEQLALVERRPDPEDKRAKIVCFTPTGEAWLDAFRQALETAERDMAAQLGKTLYTQLHNALLRYSD